MSGAAHARVRAVPNFVAGLDQARRFMVAQDAASAQVRFETLRSEVRKARNLLSFAPAVGRPVRFLEAQTGWGRFQAQQAAQLARKSGVPDLRELVLSHHVLLYAHNEREVVLLAMRHQRQLGYQLLP